MATEVTATTQNLTPIVVTETAVGAWAAPVEQGIQPVIPSIQIVQKETMSMGPESKHFTGAFWLSDKNTYENEIRGIIVMGTSTRVLFDEDSTTGPVCSSTNGYTPRPNSTVWQTGKFRVREEKKPRILNGTHTPGPVPMPRACAECPLSQWVNNDDGTSEKPACRQSYLALIELEESHELYKHRFSGMSARTYSQFRGQQIGSGFGRAKKAKPPYAQRIRLFTEPGHNRALNTTWYESRIAIEGETSPEDQVELGALAAEWANLFDRDAAIPDNEGAPHASVVHDDGGWNDTPPPANGGNPQGTASFVELDAD